MRWSFTSSSSSRHIKSSSRFLTWQQRFFNLWVSYSEVSPQTIITDAWHKASLTIAFQSLLKKTIRISMSRPWWTKVSIQTRTVRMSWPCKTLMIQPAQWAKIILSATKIWLQARQLMISDSSPGLAIDSRAWPLSSRMRSLLWASLMKTVKSWWRHKGCTCARKARQWPIYIIRPSCEARNNKEMIVTMMSALRT